LQVDAPAPAGLGDIAQPLGQFQHRQPAVRQLLVCLFGRDFAPGGRRVKVDVSRFTRRCRRIV
jgi:hypothetical protein